MSNTPTTTEPAADAEIVNLRVFKAPRERVFRAFADPALLATWWGPNGFTNTFETFDFRSGGTWKFVMRAPNGAEYANESKFEKIVPPERIVFVHLGPVHWYRMTVTYADEAGGTRLTWRMMFESVEEANKIRTFVANANEQNFDRLEACLASMA